MDLVSLLKEAKGLLEEALHTADPSDLYDALIIAHSAVDKALEELENGGEEER